MKVLISPKSVNTGIVTPQCGSNSVCNDPCALANCAANNPCTVDNCDCDKNCTCIQYCY